MNNLTFGWEKLFQWAPRGQGNPLSKIQKSLIQNGCLKPHWKFQHSSSIRKCSKIGGTEPTFGGSFRSSKGGEVQFHKLKKALYKTVVPTHIENFSILAQLESVRKSGDLKYEEQERKDILNPIWPFSKCHKNLNNRYFDTRIFAKRSYLSSKAVIFF